MQPISDNMQHNYVDMQHDIIGMLNISHDDIITCMLQMSTYLLIILYVDMKTLTVNIILLHVDIIYRACRGQKYASIESCLFEMMWSIYTIVSRIQKPQTVL